MSTIDDPHYAREHADVLDDRRVVRRMLERNENAFVHQLSQFWNVCTSSHTLRLAMSRPDRPRQHFEPHRIGERAHLHAVRREHDERKDGERELQAQNHLAENEELRRSALAIENGDNGGRHNGDEPRDQAPQPRTEADVEKALHHDLAGQRASERRVLSGREQRERERGARAGAEQRRQQLVRVLNLGDFGVSRGVKGRRRDDEDRRVDEEREAQRDRRIEEREFYRLAFAVRRLLVAARLYDRRMQVEVVRHHRRAEDADGDVEHLADR